MIDPVSGPFVSDDLPQTEAEYLDEHGDPRTLRAELADLRAKVRYLADEYEPLASGYLPVASMIERLRALVGPWPHEKGEGDALEAERDRLRQQLDMCERAYRACRRQLAALEDEDNQYVFAALDAYKHLLTLEADEE